ncbi:MAG: dihydropteroate synthase [Acidobacteriota bacterium]
MAADREGTHLTANRSWKLELPRGRTLVLDRQPRVMGILNVTPDSFSDGGRWLAPEQAIAHGIQMVRDGADMVDLGAESTRPGGGVYGEGADHVSVSEELDRLLPVLEGLRREVDVPLSADTRKGAVARAALASGADLINDVGGLADPELVAAVAEAGCPVVIMHSRGELASMQTGIHFEDVSGEVMEELGQSFQFACAHGIDSDQIILDPGIGFGKTPRGNLLLLRELDRMSQLGRPMLVGASRKSFISQVREAPPDARLGGSLAAAAWSVSSGVSILRVHDVAETRQFLDVWNAIDSALAKRN